MKWSARVVVAVGLLAAMLAACGWSEQGTAECSCAESIAFAGSGYDPRTDVDIVVGEELGVTERIEGCCGAYSRVGTTVFAVEGLDPRIGVATRAGLHLAFDLSAADRGVADEFIAAHGGGPAGASG